MTLPRQGAPFLKTASDCERIFGEKGNLASPVATPEYFRLRRDRLIRLLSKRRLNLCDGPAVVFVQLPKSLVQGFKVFGTGFVLCTIQVEFTFW